MTNALSPRFLAACLGGTLLVVLLSAHPGYAQSPEARAVYPGADQSGLPALVGSDHDDGAAGSWWAGAEYLLWWVKGAPLPSPLLTVGDTTGMGVLGSPGTRVLLGGSDVNFGPSSGARFTLGTWLDEERNLGLEANYLFLGRTSTARLFESNGRGEPLLAIPFVQIGGVPVTNPAFTPTQPGETSTLVSAPNRFSGAARLDLTTRLQGAELNVVAPLFEEGNWRVGLLGGFRWLSLREALTLDTSSPGVPPAVPDIFITRDEFGASNQFFGGQVGTDVEYRSGNLDLALTGKVALGTMQETVRINGGLLTNDLNGIGPAESFPGGYLALPSNIGRYHKGEFAVVPEVGARAGYRVTPWAEVSVGYTFLYVSDVARPGSQIDRGINTLQAPAITGNVPAPLVGPARPSFPSRQDDFWAHGLRLGLELRF